MSASVFAAKNPYTIGIMCVKVEQTQASENFAGLVDRGTALFRNSMGDLDVHIIIFQFTGPHLIPVEGAYLPFDFLQLGMSEKIERGIDFLLILTEVDLSPSSHTYVLAYPSQLTNIGIVSTKRMWPEFWGRPPNPALASQRLSALLLHIFGHLVGLAHTDDPSNVMFDFTVIDDLDVMRAYSPAQIDQIERDLPREAHEQVSQRHRTRFAIGRVGANAGLILRGLVQVNPFRLMTRLPTMVTAGISAIILFLFNAYIWTVGGHIALFQIVGFSILALVGAELLLYSSFGVNALVNRRRGLAESTVITVATAHLSLISVLLLIYLLFLALVFLATIFIIPPNLMLNWPNLTPIVSPLDHLKLAMFMAGIGVLTGSLGGRSDSPKVIRSILFLDEET